MTLAVALAHMMPAALATASTTPLAARPARMMATVSGRMRTSPSARASRAVTSLPLTSTMRARPCAPRCVRSAMAPPLYLERQPIVGQLDPLGQLAGDAPVQDVVREMRQEGPSRLQLGDDLQGLCDVEVRGMR